MISEGQYEAAKAQKAAADATIDAYFKEQATAFAVRWDAYTRGGNVFTSDELVYAAGARCETCNAGLAYPKACGISHRWDCSAALTTGSNGHGNFPFMYYAIKAENQPSANGATTRPATDGQTP